MGFFARWSITDLNGMVRCFIKARDSRPIKRR